MEMKLIEIEQNILIEATPEKVYTALTTNISDWWGKPFLINEESTDIMLEAKIGGLFYESWGTNQGYKWGEVTHLMENQILEITGLFGMSKAIYGKVCFTLSSKDHGTVVRLSHRAYGELGEQTKLGYTEGWKDLLGRRLKSLIEKGIKMGLGNEPPMDNTL